VKSGVVALLVNPPSVDTIMVTDSGSCGPTRQHILVLVITDARVCMVPTKHNVDWASFSSKALLLVRLTKVNSVAHPQVGDM